MTTAQADAVARALEAHFRGTAEYEDINGRGRYRFAITSDQFNGVPHLKRQDDIWEVVNQVLARDARLDISLIIAYAPVDLTTSR